jgi:GT2 family glycosyltransferase
MNNITLIIPVHSLDDGLDSLLYKSIKSVEDSIVKPDKLIIVHPKNKNLTEQLSKYQVKDVEITLIENAGDSSFQSQLNLGVDNVDTTYFSYLAMDDEVSKIWFKNVIEHMKYEPEVSCFLPILVETDSNNNFIGFTNDIAWASGFSDKQGYLDNNAVLNYFNLSFDGMVIKKDVYKEIGGIKPNIKLTFIIEFFLRLTYNDYQVKVVPKLGYKHTNQREGSLFVDYKKVLSEEESNFWLKTAKKEYFFVEDREIRTYVNV